MCILLPLKILEIKYVVEFRCCNIFHDFASFSKSFYFFIKHWSHVSLQFNFNANSAIVSENNWIAALQILAFDDRIIDCVLRYRSGDRYKIASDINSWKMLFAWYISNKSFIFTSGFFRKKSYKFILFCFNLTKNSWTLCCNIESLD